MPTPLVTRAPRNQPDHLDEHARLAQAFDWDRPRGIIAYKMGTTIGGAFTSATASIILLSNVALKAGRLYLISYSIRAHTQGASAGYMRTLIYVGGALISGAHDYVGVNGQYQHHVFAWLTSLPSDLTTTVDLRLDGVPGGSYWTDRGGHLKVEDIGPDRGKK